MPLGLILATAGAIAFALSLCLMPAAIALARRTGLVDDPGGWKTHARSTPYLGGLAVLLATAGAALALSDDRGEMAVLIAAATGLLAVGIIDDRVRLHAAPRLVAEAAAGALLWSADLGWQFAEPPVVGLLLTCAWVIVAVNALNLLDLMDGVAGSAAAVAAAGCAALAAIDADTGTAVLATALAAALAGFLVFNMSVPSRIFLGDGGTMAIGLLIAALTMSAVASHSGGVDSLAAAALLFGVPLVDMGARVVLRLARGIPLMTAGPDSMANRLRERLGSARRVALVAAMAQGALSAAATAALLGDPAAVIAVFLAGSVLGALAARALHAGAHPPEAARSTEAV